MAKYTKKAIIDTFMSLLNEKPLSKITVKEIIEKCEINRNTFYYYFEDIYDLIDDLFNNELQKLYALKNSPESLKEACTLALDFISTNKAGIKNIYNSVNRDQLEQYLFKFMDKITIDFVKNHIEGINISEEDILFIAAFHKYVLVGFFLDWLANDKDEELEFAFRRISSITEDSMNDFLKKAAETFGQKK